MASEPLRPGGAGPFRTRHAFHAVDRSQQRPTSIATPTGRSGGGMAEANCHVCGAKLSGWGAPGANRCRICSHSVCDAHFKDGICSFCREKLGRK